MQDSAVKTYDSDRKALIHKLMEIIAAPVDPDYLEEPKSLEEFAFSPGELSGIAAQLLRQMLELYGQYRLSLNAPSLCLKPSSFL